MSTNTAMSHLSVSTFLKFYGKYPSIEVSVKGYDLFGEAFFDEISPTLAHTVKQIVGLAPLDVFDLLEKRLEYAMLHNQAFAMGDLLTAKNMQKWLTDWIRKNHWTGHRVFRVLDDLNLLIWPATPITPNYNALKQWLLTLKSYPTYTEVAKIGVAQELRDMPKLLKISIDVNDYVCHPAEALRDLSWLNDNATLNIDYLHKRCATRLKNLANDDSDKALLESNGLVALAAGLTFLRAPELQPAFQKLIASVSPQHCILEPQVCNLLYAFINWRLQKETLATQVAFLTQYCASEEQSAKLKWVPGFSYSTAKWVPQIWLDRDNTQNIAPILAEFKPAAHTAFLHLCNRFEVRLGLLPEPYSENATGLCDLFGIAPDEKNRGYDSQRQPIMDQIYAALCAHYDVEQKPCPPDTLDIAELA